MPDVWMDTDSNVIVPVNILPLLDDTDFKSIETAVVYNSAGLVLTWNFVTTAGVQTGNAITPTTGGAFDWSEPLADVGMYAIELPASGQAAGSNNDREGFGWFTGVATGVLPWRGPIIGFRAAGLNNALIDSVYSTTRGLAGTALPDAAADAAGGLPISDGGGLDLDTQIGTDIDAILVDTGTTLQAEVDGIQADTENIQSRIPAALVGGKIDANVGSQDNIDFGALQKASLNAATPASVAGAVGSVTGAVGSVTAGVIVSDKTGFSLSVAGILAIWHQALADIVTASTVGKLIKDYLDAAITSRHASGAQVASVAGAVNSVTTDVGITQAGADKVWGTAARALTDKTDFSLSTAGILAIWHQLTAAVVTASTMGKLIVDYLDAAVSTRNATTPPTVGAIRTEMDANSTKLANLDATVTSRHASGAAVASVSGSVNSVATDVGITQAGADKVWSTAARALTDKAGFALSTAGVQAIWDALTSALTTVNSIGKRLVDYVDAAISGRAAAGDQMDLVNAPNATAITAIQSGLAVEANVQTHAAAALTAYDPPTKAELDTAVSTIRGVDSDTLKTLSDQLDTVTTDTNELQTDWVNGGRLDLLVDGIKAKTDNLPASPAAVGSAMTLDLTQVLDTTPTSETVGDALLAARAQGFGKWALVGTTLTLYAADGTTAVKTFTLDDADTPTSRTPA